MKFLSHGIARILQAQSALQQSLFTTLSSSSTNSSSFSFSSLGGVFGGLRDMSTTTSQPQLSPAEQRDVSSILDFWFSQPPLNWFAHPDPGAFDATITERFGHLCERARSNDLGDGWSETPRGALASIILLDQFPRNVYRGTPDAHSSDPLALDLATRSVAREFDRQVDPLQAIFFYLPLEHDETLVSQIASVACYEALKSRCAETHPDHPVDFLDRSIAFAKSHRDVIARFGRFPSRNKVLGRQSTDEEIRFLEENPSGFY
ncbi:hypothetical protein, variant [Exophiala oligosperma]|uniref:DUF924 domain-containing protein n=1 Tax=Exophiala oligosperma TaxID=215243 RepID=A0A0D2DW33_9EURO|nr:hypothetical protein, variant [Exophiala oligosperma]KIW47308.1 hypothetical protein, variant [Exophiala oligosperma]